MRILVAVLAGLIAGCGREPPIGDIVDSHTVLFVKDAASLPPQCIEVGVIKVAQVAGSWFEDAQTLATKSASNEALRLGANYVVVVAGTSTDQKKGPAVLRGVAYKCASST